MSDDSVEVHEDMATAGKEVPSWANPLAPPACSNKPVSRTVITES